MNAEDNVKVQQLLSNRQCTSAFLGMRKVDGQLWSLYYWQKTEDGGDKYVD